MKSLIAYYSRRGENLVNGSVQRLTVGNTELIAAVLQKFTDADCFLIEPCEAYPEDYYQCIDQARQDLQRNVRPKLKKYPESISPYDVIYLGYPNYWGTMPMAVFSFLERFDFTGKTVKPFCTHDGGGMGHSERDLKCVCPTAHIAPGLSIHGAEFKYELSSIEDWVRETESTPLKKQTTGGNNL
ncbi:flavodoxin [Clostridium transplantifaecale]|uniref:flavodoxin n=1 Tax=Clostridium transplantifaecale TaxID=2479838 RepID=UPI000F62FF8E|nr:flavodoxin [Clostridium transplantifaecale]